VGAGVGCGRGRRRRGQRKGRMRRPFLRRVPDAPDVPFAFVDEPRRQFGAKLVFLDVRQEARGFGCVDFDEVAWVVVNGIF